MRSFVDIDLGREPAPDETTMCKFRHLLERHGLGKQMLLTVNGYLARHGLKIGTGTIVEATILHAPSSTKNKLEQRDPEMHQRKKGNQWYFGMKPHVGIDAGTKLIRSVVATAANVADSQGLPEFLHGEETDVWGDQVYQGKTGGRPTTLAQAVDRTHRKYRTKLVCYPAIRIENRQKSRTCSRVEHLFALIKLKFGFVKLRYRGLEKNRNRLFSACALINFLTARNLLLQVAGQTCA